MSLRRHFVYYRVPESRLAEALAAARHLQAQLRLEHAALHCELWRRPGARDGLATLMEVYGGPIDDALAYTIETRAQQALQGLIEGDRHVEVFIGA